MESNLLRHADSCKYLIINFSRLEQMVWLIDKVVPLNVHIIVSNVPQFKNAAINLQEIMINQNIMTQITVINDSNSVSESFNAGLHAILNSKFTIDSIIVDVTGGTKPMSIGVYEAAKDQNIEAITYVSMEFDGPGKPIYEKTKIISLH